MAEENAFRYAEYAHPVAVKGRVRLQRFLLLLGVVLGSLGYVVLTTVAIRLPQLIALLPLIIWIFLLFTWRTVSYECVCRVEDGRLSLGRAVGKNYRERFSCRVKELLSIGQESEESKARARGDFPHAKTLDFTSGADVPMRCVAVACVGGQHCILRFDAYEEILRAIRFYNKDAFTK